MNKTTLPGEKYEQQILEPLGKMGREGKGRIVELYPVRFGDRTLPFVCFSTGETVMVTAGFCPYAAFGTYETVLQICDSGIEGVTSFPTVTPKLYDEAIRYVERGKEDNDIVTLVRGLFGLGTYGESDEPGTFRMFPLFDWMGWDAVRQHTAIKKLKTAIHKSKVVLDLRNGYTMDGSYILLGTPVENSRQKEVDDAIVDEIESRGHRISTYVNGLYPSYRGNILYGPRDRLCKTAAELGALNIVVNIPTVTYSNGIRMTDVKRNVETNMTVVRRVAKLLR